MILNCFWHVFDSMHKLKLRLFKMQVKRRSRKAKNWLSRF